jgi:phage-related protein
LTFHASVSVAEVQAKEYSQIQLEVDTGSASSFIDDTNQTLSLPATELGFGDSVKIDNTRKRVTKNGIIIPPEQISIIGKDWISLQPGTNSLVFADGIQAEINY